MFKSICLAFIITGITVPAYADDAVNFGRFLGLISAIEDFCPKYTVRTDAVMGGDLSEPDYQSALKLSDQEKLKAKTVIQKIGCDRSAQDAVTLSGKTFFEVWEVSP